MVIYGSMFLQQFISVSVLHILKIIVEHFLTLIGHDFIKNNPYKTPYI